MSERRRTDMRLLVVEDNQDDEYLVLESLQELGFPVDVVVLRDGQAALDYLLGEGAYTGRANARLPDVVLMDLKLPKVLGTEVLRRLRLNERTRLLPVVLFTSSREDQDRSAGYRLGANSYLHKPVEFDRFSEVVREFGRYWLEWNERAPLEAPGAEA